MNDDWDELQKAVSESIAANKNPALLPPELEKYRQTYLTVMDQYRQDVRGVAEEEVVPSDVKDAAN